MWSLRSRIVFMLVNALIVSGLVTVWATYHTTRTELSAVFDEQLKQTALALVEKGGIEDFRHVVIVGQSPTHQLLVQIYDSHSNKLYLSSPHKPLPLAERQGFSDFTLDQDEQWRQYTSTIGAKIIQVAQPVKIRSDLAVSAAMHIVQPLMVLIPFLAIAIWFVIVQSLQPLNKTARAIALRSPTSMTPIATEGLPYELKSLVEALNSLMARLGESLSAQQRFASDAAHELRTPLAAIKLQAQLLSRAKTDELRAKYTERLQQGVARGVRLVQQLLTIARLDPDAAHKPMTSVDLAAIATSVAEDLSISAEGKNIALSAHVEPISVMGMEDALRLLITNLTDNAIRYTPEGGRIEIAVAPEGNGAAITITDNGPGIAPEERKRVFERFYRALGTKVSGTGLGLAIVARIVQLHAGTIAIEDGFAHESDSGCGACFRVHIPAEPPRSDLSRLI